MLRRIERSLRGEYSCTSLPVSVRAASTRSKPFSASASAVARPMPRLEPVTSATRRLIAGSRRGPSIDPRPAGSDTPGLERRGRETVKGSELAVKLALTPTGAAIDRLCVRHLGHSPVSWLFARSDGVPYNRPLLLVTRGRRTGRERSAVLPWFDAGEGAVAIVGSRGGAPTDPHWARNLRARPEARVHVSAGARPSLGLAELHWSSGPLRGGFAALLGRREHRVRARLAQGAERASLWESIVARAPVYAAYQERARAHREIPVFVLERADGGAFEL